ncbi:hypothetical protein PsAD2_02775 [Pseudovibrio axinellae]|uniref:Uncharacterized protein n=1 Tax=Pseudovibrio axinellae TaxID=989403 RepID=A0A165XU38_9HYPH|nr:hypothetical protein PsAD2_02775 [Pseudovibrio axinellae]SER12527.1 hypothetical protein SAMN05421798_106205 [Pseudovibrio axinellae]
MGETYLETRGMRKLGDICCEKDTLQSKVIFWNIRG